MREETIARNYATALYELAVAHREVDAYLDAFQEFGSALTGGSPVQRFLTTPKIDAAEKQRVLRTALEGRVPERFLRFVMVVIEKRRQSVLPAIREAFQALVDEKAGRLMAEVTLAREPDEATVTVITERLSALLDKQVVPQITVDPAILGGLVVRYNDRRIDGSVRRQLLSLKRDMLHANLPGLPAETA